MTQDRPRRRTCQPMAHRLGVAAALFGAVLAGLSAPALAQGAAGAPAVPSLLPPPAETSNPGTGPGPNPGAAAGRRGGPQAIERRIQEWHDRLRITPAQEAQWNAFAAAMRENLQHIQTARADQRQAAAGGASGTGATALDEMRSYARAAQAHAQDVQRLVGPFEALYNSLSPEQRQAADQAFRRFAEREGRGRRRLE